MPTPSELLATELADDQLDSIDRLLDEELATRSLSDVVVPPQDAGSTSLADDTSLADAIEMVEAFEMVEAVGVVAQPGGWSSVNFAAFQQLPFEDPLSNGVLVALVIAITAGALVVIGAGMRLACRLTGGDHITVRRGMVATLALSAAYVFTGVAVARLTTGGLVIASQIIVGSVVLGCIVWQNPIRALATSIVASILQTVFLFGFFAAAFIAIGRFVPPHKVHQLAHHLESFTDSMATDVIPGDQQRTRRLLSLRSLTASEVADVEDAETVAEDEGVAGGDISAKTKSIPIYQRGLRNNPFVQGTNGF